jgi:hypothetical protein
VHDVCLIAVVLDHAETNVSFFKNIMKNKATRLRQKFMMMLVWVGMKFDSSRPFFGHPHTPPNISLVPIATSSIAKTVYLSPCLCQCATLRQRSDFDQVHSPADRLHSRVSRVPSFARPTCVQDVRSLLPSLEHRGRYYNDRLRRSAEGRESVPRFPWRLPRGCGVLLQNSWSLRGHRRPVVRFFRCDRRSPKVERRLRRACCSPRRFCSRMMMIRRHQPHDLLPLIMLTGTQKPLPELVRRCPPCSTNTCTT